MSAGPTIGEAGAYTDQQASDRIHGKRPTERNRSKVLAHNGQLDRSPANEPGKKDQTPEALADTARYDGAAYDPTDPGDPAPNTIKSEQATADRDTASKWRRIGKIQHGSVPTIWAAGMWSSA
jgi:hypothetical protein